nr:hypothetical protein [Oscillatoria sp. HE19RPO]
MAFNPWMLAVPQKGEGFGVRVSPPNSYKGKGIAKYKSFNRSSERKVCVGATPLIRHYKRFRSFIFWSSLSKIINVKIVGDSVLMETPKKYISNFLQNRVDKLLLERTTFTSKLPGSKVEIKREGTGNIEHDWLHPVNCFPGQLNQVFMNILANAIDVFDDRVKQSSFAEIRVFQQINPPNPDG